MSLEIREKAEGEILRMRTMREIPLPTLLAFAGIPERTWREWQGRRGLQTRHNNNIPRSYYLTPGEEAAIVRFCQDNCVLHPEKGYRTLCWEMVDKNIAFVGASSVYNVIKRHKLDKEWAQMTEKAEGEFEQPKAVHVYCLC